MLRMVRTLTLALAALVVPGGLVVLALWKLLGRLRLRQDVGLPLHSPSGAIILTRSDWERLMELAHPVRWAITRMYDWPRRRRLAKLPKMTHRDVILTWPFRALASWVEKNHAKVWAPPSESADPLYENYWAAMAEVRSLYAWWLARDKRLKDLDGEDPSVREYGLEAMREEDQLMLARLVNVRTYLD